MSDKEQKPSPPELPGTSPKRSLAKKFSFNAKGATVKTCGDLFLNSDQTRPMD
jgi:hypothetical protein